MAPALAMYSSHQIFTDYVMNHIHGDASSLSHVTQRVLPAEVLHALPSVPPLVARWLRPLYGYVGQVLAYLIAPPLLHLMLNGPCWPSGLFWCGMPLPEICASLTQIPAAHWHANIDMCHDRIYRHYYGYFTVVSFVVYMSVLYRVGNSTFGLAKSIASAACASIKTLASATCVGTGRLLRWTFNRSAAIFRRQSSTTQSELSSDSKSNESKSSESKSTAIGSTNSDDNHC
jgi:hypothetical protein